MACEYWHSCYAPSVSVNCDPSSPLLQFTFMDSALSFGVFIPVMASGT